MYCGHTFGVSDSEYPNHADKELLVIVQIESRQGVDNVEEIAKVEGLDCLFIGESQRFCSCMRVWTVEFG